LILIEGVMDNKKNLEHVFRPETASAGGFFISRHVRYEYVAAFSKKPANWPNRPFLKMPNRPEFA
jgi:hypothetical protein